MRHEQESSSDEQLTERLARLEQLLTRQQAHLEAQAAEIAHLRAAIASAQDSGEDLVPTTVSVEHVDHDEHDAHADQSNGAGRARRGTSRRTLLKFGGVAAAASVAAVATNVAGNNAPVAHAAGVAWQTGTVSADTETIVQPSSSSYSANDMLQLKLGTGSVYKASTLKTALAAYDTTSQNVGVYASSQNGVGVYGVTDTGTGGKGVALNGTANSTGIGVSGNSQSGFGIVGTSNTGIGGSFSGGQAPLLLGLSGSAGAPTTGTHAAGEIYADGNASLYVCNVPGAFGGGGATPSFYRLSSVNLLSSPVRLFDTRAGQPAVTNLGRAIAPHETYALTVAGGPTPIPANAVAVIGNITVLGPSAPGNLIFYPAGTSKPTTASLTYGSAGLYLANFTIAGVGSNGQVNINVDSDNAYVNMVFDCVGFIL